MLKPSGIPIAIRIQAAVIGGAKSAPPLNVSEQKYDQNIVFVSIFLKQTWLQKLEQPSYSFDALVEASRWN